MQQEDVKDKLWILEGVLGNVLPNLATGTVAVLNHHPTVLFFRKYIDPLSASVADYSSATILAYFKRSSGVSSLSSEMTLTDAVDIPTQSRQNDDESGIRLGESPGLDYPSSYGGWRTVPHNLSGQFNTLSILGEGGSSEEGGGDSRTSTPTYSVEMLPGERTEETARFVNSILTLTNYRVCIISENGQACAVITHVDLDTVDAKDPLQLVITCKEGRVFRLTAASSELACYWYKKLTQLIYRASTSECFAYQFGASVKTQKPSWIQRAQVEEEVAAQFDFSRLEFNPDHFRVTDKNAEFEICETYPQTIIVPAEITDEDLKKGRDFRFLGRFPSVVWRCKQKNTVLLRSSQPRTGLFSWRNPIDERILEAVQRSMEDQDGPNPFITILDARSYTAAWANRAKGGGFESAEYYKNTEVQFLGLPNIHNIRYSFHQLRALLNSPADQNTYLQQLQATNWFHHLSNLMASGVRCVDLLMEEGHSVLVHCSDGWDRTTQIVSFAKILADPYYRTMQGFESVIRREWVAFGHKFADRNGVFGSDSNERAPVFLQFLDGVHQLMVQHSTAFEFNMNYLVKLAQHTYSGLFGTFLHNSLKDAREAINVSSGDPPSTVSIWRYLHKDNIQVVNHLYDASKFTGRLPVLYGVEHTVLWKEVYCCGQTEQEINSPGDRQTMTSVVIGAMARAEMEKSLVKSNSSDSLNSAHKTAIEGGGIVGNALHGSNTKLNEVPSSDSLIDAQSLTDSMLIRQHSMARNRQSDASSGGIKDLIDQDGLVYFHDPVQEQCVKFIMARKAEQETMRAELSRARQRFNSERTEASSYSTRNTRYSNDLCESDGGSLDRVPSETSIVEFADVGCHPGNGWTVNEKKCSRCKIHYTPINREHHCRNCLKSVCDACSQQRYHVPVGCGSEHLRACDDCYAKMNNPAPPVVDETDGVPNLPPPRPLVLSTVAPISVPLTTNYTTLDHTGSTGSLTSQSSFSTGNTQAVQG